VLCLSEYLKGSHSHLFWDSISYEVVYFGFSFSCHFVKLAYKAPFFFWSLIAWTSLVSILGAMAIAISSWKSNLQA
jgi:hypothetical protein